MTKYAISICVITMAAPCLDVAAAECMDQFEYLRNAAPGTSPAGPRAPRISEIKSGHVKQWQGKELPPVRSHSDAPKPNFDNLDKDPSRFEYVVIKFKDDSLASVSTGRISLPEPAQSAALAAILSRYPEFEFQPESTRISPDWLTAMRFCSYLASGEDTGDFTSLFVAKIGENQYAARRIVRELNQHPLVESAWLRPGIAPTGTTRAPTRAKPALVDYSPPTPWIGYKQWFWDASPLGLNLRNYWSLPGADGSGLRYVDYEFDWGTYDHEDFPIINQLAPGTGSDSDKDHGTATLGIISAIRQTTNAYGLDGGLSGAQGFTGGGLYFSSTDLLTLSNANTLRKGDALVLPMAFKSDPLSSCAAFSDPNNATIPMERDASWFSAIRQLSNSGVIVFETGGNGGLYGSLDDACWNGGFFRRHDSKAIIVSARYIPDAECPQHVDNPTPPTQFTGLDSANYGWRVDANAWGTCVWTTGKAGSGGYQFPEWFQYGPVTDPRQFYTYAFIGTSASTPIVMSAAMSWQGWERARPGNRTFSPRAIRYLINRFAASVPSDRPIGKQPDIGAGFAWLMADDNNDGIINGDQLAIDESPIPHLANTSSRGLVQTGEGVMIGSFYFEGSQPKTVAIRGIGPSLIPYGINNALSNPTLQLLKLLPPPTGWVTVATNDDWTTAPNAAQIQSSGFAPSYSLESVILSGLSEGSYSVILSGANNQTGTGLLEIYELDHFDQPLLNTSMRGYVGSGNDVMIGGFVVQGSGAQEFVITVNGPSLYPYGISNPLGNPSLTLVRSSNNSVVASNDNWADGPNANKLSQSGNTPSQPLEPALLISLDPGAYTAIVSGVGGATGVAVVNISPF